MGIILESITCPGQFDALHKQSCNAFGTVQKDRKFILVDLKTVKLRHSEVASCSTEVRLMVLVWKDSKDVYMLSIRHTSKMVQTGK